MSIALPLLALVPAILRAQLPHDVRISPELIATDTVPVDFRGASAVQRDSLTLFAWVGGYEDVPGMFVGTLRVRFVSSSGEPVGEERVVSEPDARPGGAVAIRATDSVFVVFWCDVRSGAPETYARVLSRNGTPIGNEVRVAIRGFNDDRHLFLLPITSGWRLVIGDSTDGNGTIVVDLRRDLGQPKMATGYGGEVVRDLIAVHPGQGDALIRMEGTAPTRYLRSDGTVDARPVTNLPSYPAIAFAADSAMAVLGDSAVSAYRSIFDASPVWRASLPRMKDAYYGFRALQRDTAGRRWRAVHLAPNVPGWQYVYLAMLHAVTLDDSGVLRSDVVVDTVVLDAGNPPANPRYRAVIDDHAERDGDGGYLLRGASDTWFLDKQGVKHSGGKEYVSLRLEPDGRLHDANDRGDATFGREGILPLARIDSGGIILLTDAISGDVHLRVANSSRRINGSQTMPAIVANTGDSITFSYWYHERAAGASLARWGFLAADTARDLGMIVHPEQMSGGRHEGWDYRYVTGGGGSCAAADELVVFSPGPTPERDFIDERFHAILPSAGGWITGPTLLSEKSILNYGRFIRFVAVGRNEIAGVSSAIAVSIELDGFRASIVTWNDAGDTIRASTPRLLEAELADAFAVFPTSIHDVLVLRAGGELLRIHDTTVAERTMLAPARPGEVMRLLLNGRLMRARLDASDTTMRVEIFDFGTGTTRSSAFPVDGTARDIAIIQSALDSSVAIIHGSDSGVRGSLLDQNGQLLHLENGASLTDWNLSEARTVARHPAGCFNRDQLIVIWEDYRNGAPDIYGAVSGVPRVRPASVPIARPDRAMVIRGGVCRLDLTMTREGESGVEVVDVDGRRVMARELGRLGAGEHVVDLDLSAVAPGIYLARAISGAELVGSRVILVMP